jgi:Holliday junction resolvase RusA-like endonuclease
MTTYIFPGEPVPKGRPRSTHSGHTYTPTRTKQGEEAIRWELKAQGAKPIDQPTLVAVNLQFRCKSKTADLDNLVKLVLDAAQGFLWENDRQVCRIVAEVERGSSEPETRLVVSAYEHTYGDAA